MEPRIPIPTDNIYKFYALLGLVLLISGVLLKVYAVQSTNELAFSIAPELSALEAKKELSPEEITTKELLLKRLEISTRNREEYRGMSLWLFAFSVIAMVVGFGNWHYKVQPKQDKLLDLQIAKAELELKQTELVKCSRKRP